MVRRERVEHAGHEVGLAGGDQRGELGRPISELRCDAGLRCPGVRKVDALDPRTRPGERDVGVQGAVGLAVGLDALAGHDREHRSAADGFRRRRVLLVGIE